MVLWILLKRPNRWMPRFGGTGPLGQGPMTGRGQGFCVLTTSKENPGQVKGFAGLQSVLVGQINRAKR